MHQGITYIFPYPVDVEKIIPHEPKVFHDNSVKHKPRRQSDSDLTQVSDAIRGYYNISYGTNLPPLPEIQRSYNYCVELIIEDLSDKRDRDIR